MILMDSIQTGFMVVDSVWHTPKVQDYTTHVPANYSPLPIFSDSVCGFFTTHRVCYGGVAWLSLVRTP